MQCVLNAKSMPGCAANQVKDRPTRLARRLISGQEPRAWKAQKWRVGAEWRAALV
jgi:hypothetical protein